MQRGEAPLQAKPHLPQQPQTGGREEEQQDEDQVD
jgi:hypothetical protein